MVVNMLREGWGGVLYLKTIEMFVVFLQLFRMISRFYDGYAFCPFAVLKKFNHSQE